MRVRIIASHVVQLLAGGLRGRVQRSAGHELPTPRRPGLEGAGFALLAAPSRLGARGARALRAASERTPGGRLALAGIVAAFAVSVAAQIYLLYLIVSLLER